VTHTRGKAVAVYAVAVLLFGCAWVSVTEEGQNVRVIQSSEAAGCTKIGNVSAKTTDRIIIFARSDRKVRKELESLARNEATELGGDAVAPVGTAEEGRQSFDVYQCQLR
jgi:hypothetical protein